MCIIMSCYANKRDKWGYLFKLFLKIGLEPNCIKL